MAASFLAATTQEQVLDSACGHPANASKLRALAVGLDHIGFMAPIDAEPLVTRAALAAGFDRNHRTFPSTILELELSELHGRRIPTTIFKASRAQALGSPMVVEVAMPHGVDSGLVDDWIDRGIGAHIALRLRHSSHFLEATRIMRNEGFEVPAFMRRGAIANDAEGIRVVYFVHLSRPQVPRLEFCHYS